ncbi:TIGR02449 family protein [Candidatus Pelagadaptatus aseana]|uniref:TIGR02449 family protein n=1 Tax=Candidatus Pelagadaptatus aseana TaxID=3120508 RepID=UPI003C70276D
MTDQLLQTLESKLEQLLTRCNRLQEENQAYRAKETEWQQERTRLVEKNELARNRVEAMITRLKSLETD